MKNPKFVVRSKDKQEIVTLEGGAIKNKRDFILEYLRQRGQDGAFVMEMFRGWKTLCTRIGKDPGTYDTFRTSIYQAKIDGLIEPFKREKGDYNFPRVYYRIRVYRK